MDRKLRDLRKAMDNTTHAGKHFTEEHKDRIRKAICSDDASKESVWKKYTIYGITSFAIFILAILLAIEFLEKPNDGALSGGVVNEEEVRQEFTGNGNPLFTIFPDPELSAGSPYGYVFHFTEPFKTYKGKKLAIFAEHVESGERVTALAPQLITEPSSGYDSLQRYTVTFELPKAGLWKYEVFLDEHYYGDVLLSVGEKPGESSDVLPPFVRESDFEQIDWERKAVVFNKNIIGNVNKSGVIGADQPSLNGQKWMWHLWGISQDTKLTIVGFHRDTKTAHSIINLGWTTGLSGGNNGADAHIPSTVRIPKRGEWAILLYTDEELFDILIYDIQE